LPVVINEFEVVAEPSQAGPPGPSKDGKAPEPAVTWTTHDVEKIVRRAAERAARVRAD
jgi:hypothetical protein